MLNWLLRLRHRLVAWMQQRPAASKHPFSWIPAYTPLMSSRNIRLRSLAEVVGACHTRGKSLASAST